jgi:hypothetical protein
VTISVQQFLAGFIASDADVSSTHAGTMQVRIRVGVEHWRREQNGIFTNLENSFRDMLLVRRTTERAADQFRTGDPFVAHAYVEARYAKPPARPAELGVHVAPKIGHDLARTTYDVDRTPAPARPDPHHLQHATVGSVTPPAADEQRSPTPPDGVTHPTAPRPGASTGSGIGV